ncbi:MAG: hypothetical protein K6T65_10360 [Peptococcaceae bacterium]|nr:hypothetical protein [Peptococcaceae bacterium]
MRKVAFAFIGGTKYTFEFTAPFTWKKIGMDRAEMLLAEGAGKIYIAKSFPVYRELVKLVRYS